MTAPSVPLLFDTDVLIDYLRGRTEAVDYIGSQRDGLNAKTARNVEAPRAARGRGASVMLRSAEVTEPTSCRPCLPCHPCRRPAGPAVPSPQAFRRRWPRW